MAEPSRQSTNTNNWKVAPGTLNTRQNCDLPMHTLEMQKHQRLPDCHQTVQEFLGHLSEYQLSHTQQSVDPCHSMKLHFQCEQRPRRVQTGQNCQQLLQLLQISWPQHLSLPARRDERERHWRKHKLVNTAKSGKGSQVRNHPEYALATQLMQAKESAICREKPRCQHVTHKIKKTNLGNSERGQVLGQSGYGMERTTDLFGRLFQKASTGSANVDGDYGTTSTGHANFARLVFVSCPTRRAHANVSLHPQQYFQTAMIIPAAQLFAASQRSLVVV